MRTLCAALLVVCLGAFALGCKKRGASTEPGVNKDGVVPSGPGPVPGASGAGKRGSFTVGKSTTFVTGPVDSTGHVDYAAALNDRLSKGVTAGNNANVAIWKVLGPNPVGAKVPAGFFEKMGMQAPPAGGEYYLGLRAYCNRSAPGQADAAFDAMGKLGARAWTTNENATLAGWLQANEKPLAALREAVKKTHFYSPIIPERTDKGSKGLMSSLLPGPQMCRELGGALVCRAMLYLGHNQPAEAWQDLIACHRLARLAGRGGTLIEGLVGIAIEQLACRGEVAFLDRAKPDAKWAEGCLHDLFALPPIAPVAEKIDLAERFSFLDTVMQLDAQGPGFLESLAGEGKGPSRLGEETFNGIDWNVALESGNKWFDRMGAAAREKDRAKRNQQLDQVEADLRKMKDSVDRGAIGGAGSAAARGQAMGDLLTGLLLPAARKVTDAGDRIQQTFDTVAVGYALVWYQRVNGQYPDSLAKLAPNFLTAVPGDVFSGRELIYRPAANGFVLYGVGPNGIDDGGRGYDAQPPGDDIVVRIPKP